MCPEFVLPKYNFCFIKSPEDVIIFFLPRLYVTISKHERGQHDVSWISVVHRCEGWNVKGTKYCLSKIFWRWISILLTLFQDPGLLNGSVVCMACWNISKHLKITQTDLLWEIEQFQHRLYCRYFPKWVKKYYSWLWKMDLLAHQVYDL